MFLLLNMLYRVQAAEAVFLLLCMLSAPVPLWRPAHSRTGAAFAGLPPSALTSVRRMFQNSTQVLERKLQTTAWFKDHLRTVALREAIMFKFVLGFTEEFYNESVVEALYVDYRDVDANFVTAYLQIKHLLAYREIRGNGIEDFQTAIPGAHYRNDGHRVIVRFGILHPPIFTAGAPAAMNYGTIGQVLGHEVMHAFDVTHITKDHRVQQITQNIKNTTAEFEKRGLCLRASYQRAESASRARSLTSQTEGIADYGGTLLAYDAFRHLPPETRAETVPAVGLSAEQTFFVAHCIKWCHADKSSRIRPSGSHYWHQRSRCIVPLQNMPQFADAFNCKAGDYMNTGKKCEVW